MTDKSEIASAALPPAAVSFTNAAQGMVNTGSGVQVGTNTGIMNFNFNGFGPEMTANLMLVVLNIGARGFNDGLFFDSSAIEPQQIRTVFEKIFVATDQIQHYKIMMNVR